MNNNQSMRNHIRVVRVLSAVIALFQLAYFLLSWVATDATQVGPVTMAFYPRGLEAGAVAGLTPAMRWAGTLCALPALLSLGYALVRLDRMLQACAGGHMFALPTVAHMKAFAASLLAALTLTVIEPALRGAVWHFGFHGAAGRIKVGVSSEELMLVLICTLFFVVASMLHEARRIAEDNEGFV